MLFRSEAALRGFALAYPETHEDFPWGDRVIKVRGKVFIFMGLADGGLGLSVKLPYSRDEALKMKGTKPTPYGLGKSGWVSAIFAKGKKAPLDLLKEWVDESYRAVAPKNLAALVPAPTSVKLSRAPARGSSRKSPARKRKAGGVRGSRTGSSAPARRAR